MPVPPMSTALLLIEVQQSFCARPDWSEIDLPDFLRHTDTLLAGCQQQGVPVLRIFHTDGPRRADNPFAPANGLVRPLDGLAPLDAAEVVQSRPAWLAARQWLARQMPAVPPAAHRRTGC